MFFALQLMNDFAFEIMPIVIFYG